MAEAPKISLQHTSTGPHGAFELAQLPEPALDLVLQQLDPHSRASTAACCFPLSLAVPAKTVKVEVDCSKRETLASLTLWLDRHSTSLGSLSHLSVRAEGQGWELGVPWSPVHMCQLPCRQLRELHLCGLRLQLEPEGGWPGVLHGCADLTALQLQSCWVQDAYAACVALAALSELQCLELDVVDSQRQPLLPDLQDCLQLTRLSLNCRAERLFAADDLEEQEEDQQDQQQLHEEGQLDKLTALVNLQHLSLSGLISGVPGGLLSQLVKLTRLRVHYDEDRRDSLSEPPDVAEQLQHLSSLTALQELSVCVLYGQLAASSLSGLEHLSQLASLEIESEKRGFTFSNSSTYRWDRLTALKSLLLTGCDVQPDTLAALTHLQALSLRSVCASEGTTVEDLLQAVSRLSMLTSIDVVDAECRNGGWIGPRPQAAAFTALTASTNLCSYRLSSVIDRYDFPILFRPGQLYPQLRRVDLTQGGERGAMHISKQLLQQLCSCCPAVESLAVGLWHSPSATSWLPLLQLSALTHLRAYTLKAATTATEAAAVLPIAAQLTGLKQLRLDRLGQVDGTALLQLTALTALTELQLDISGVGEHLHLRSKAHECSPLTCGSSCCGTCSSDAACCQALLKRSRGVAAAPAVLMAVLAATLADELAASSGG